MAERTNNEPLSDLLDDLFVTLDSTVRYLHAIREQLVNDTYTPAKAHADYETLVTSEELNVVAVLAEIADRV